jgi:hypothetical protein
MRTIVVSPALFGSAIGRTGELTDPADASTSMPFSG